MASIPSADIGVQTVSDHTWVTCLLAHQVTDCRGPNWSHNKSLLLDTVLFENIVEEITNYFRLNSDCGVSYETVWDAFKAVLRGYFISVAASCRKTKTRVVSDLKAKIAFLEDWHRRRGGKRYLRRLEIERKKLALYETSQAQHNLLFLKHKYASRSPRFLRWLKWKASKIASLRFVTSLRTRHGSLATQPSQILLEFTDYYRQLYASANPSEASIAAYLAATKFDTKLSSQRFLRCSGNHHRNPDSYPQIKVW